MLLKVIEIVSAFIASSAGIYLGLAWSNKRFPKGIRNFWAIEIAACFTTLAYYLHGLETNEVCRNVVNKFFTSNGEYFDGGAVLMVSFVALFGTLVFDSVSRQFSRR